MKNGAADPLLSFLQELFYCVPFITLSLTERQSSEYVGALELLKSCEGMIIVTDKGYDSAPFRYLIGAWERLLYCPTEEPS